jgi:hypothetical protein
MTTNPIRPPRNPLRLYFHQFQSVCCTLQRNSRKPSRVYVPQPFNDEAQQLSTSTDEYIINKLTKLARYTCIIPRDYFVDRHRFVLDWNLIDDKIYLVLTERLVINWMPTCQPIYPLRTLGRHTTFLVTIRIMTEMCCT